MRKHLIFETVRSIASPPLEEEGNVNKESAVGKSFASLTNFQHINNLSLAKLELYEKDYLCHIMSLAYCVYQHSRKQKHRHRKHNKHH